MSEDTKAFMEGRLDFGTKPADYELTDSQKKLAALSMAINAAIVQFILEQIIPTNQQIHFMGHLQDFAERIYNGESIKMPGTNQTMQINSKVGNLFYEAAENALAHGSENFSQLKKLSKNVVENSDQTEQAEHVTTKPTVH